MNKSSKETNSERIEQICVSLIEYNDNNIKIIKVRSDKRNQ